MYALLIVLCLVVAGMVILQYQTTRRRDREFVSTVTELTARHAKERHDLLDRLMARNLNEVKTAQAIEEGGPPRAISKRENEVRAMEMARKVAEGRQ